jgi:hypothetical protein
MCMDGDMELQQANSILHSGAELSCDRQHAMPQLGKERIKGWEDGCYR